MSTPFKFNPNDDGFEVSVRGKVIGDILPAKESSGRHCFYLKCDGRKTPRTYRGKLKAAEALYVIFKLKTEAKKKKWSTERLIIEAWDERPRASQNA